MSRGKLRFFVKSLLPHAERGDTRALERLRSLTDEQMLELQVPLIERIASAFHTDAERAHRGIPPPAPRTPPRLQSSEMAQ